MTAPILQRCQDCAQWQHPRRDVCRHCLSDQLTDVTTSGHGRAVARADIAVTLDPAWTHQLPLAAVVVVLEEGVALIALADPDVAAGDAVLVSQYPQGRYRVRRLS